MLAGGRPLPSLLSLRTRQCGACWLPAPVTRHSPPPRPAFCSRSDGTLCLRIESGAADVAASSWRSALLVAAGRDPYELVDRAVAAAARLSGEP